VACVTCGTCKWSPGLQSDGKDAKSTPGGAPSRVPGPPESVTFVAPASPVGFVDVVTISGIK